jgi:hypothetical protein
MRCSSARRSWRSGRRSALRAWPAGLSRSSFSASAVQAGVRGGIVKRAQLQLQLRHRACRLAGSAGPRFRCCAAARPGARPARGPELRFLRLALQRALLLAGIGQLALGLHHRVFQLGVALLRVGQLRSSSSKRASPVARRSCSSSSCASISASSSASCPRGRWACRPAGSGAAVPPAAGGRGSAASLASRRAPVARRCEASV